MLPLAPLLAVAGGGTASADSPTSAARAAAALGEQVGAGAVALRVALLVGAAIVAGIALVTAWTGTRPGRGLQVTTWVAAGVVAVAAETVHLTGDVSVLGTVLQVVAALAAAALVGNRWSALPGALLVVLLAVQLGSMHNGLPFVLDAAYAVGATLLAGAGAVAVADLAGRATSPAAGVALRGRSAAPAAAPGRRSQELADAETVRFTAVPAAATTSEDGAEDGPEAAPAGTTARRGLRPVAVAGGVLAAVAALVQLLVSGPETGHDLLGSAYGLASLAAVVLPALAVAALLVTAVVRIAERGRELLRISAVLGVVGLAAAGVLAALPPPGPAPVPGQAYLRAASVGGQSVAVLVAPLRPGPNLVHVSGDFSTGGADGADGADDTGDAAVPAVASHHGTTPTTTATVAVGDAPPVPITARDGAGGGWAVVDLPAGTGALTVTVGAGSTTVPVDTGDEADTGPAAVLAGPDGPECAAALLGDLAGQRAGTDQAPVTACPSDALSDTDGTALAATVRGILSRGVDRIRLVADDSPRARAAADLVRATAPDAEFVDEPDANSALVVVGGWAQARTTLDDAASRALETPTHLGGTYLAPWLLTPGVVTATASSVLPLTFDPGDTLARRYAGTVASIFPGEPPATEGFLAWARHEGVPQAARATLYGAAPVDVPMTSTGEHHAGTPNPASWFPGGTVVPVSTPLD